LYRYVAAPGCAAAPHSEALRRLMLLVSAAAPKVAKFIAAVPSVRATLEAEAAFEVGLCKLNSVCHP
jgi:hypothetical protein